MPFNQCPINQCVVVIKQTAFAKGGRAAAMARKGDTTARRILHAHKEHERTVDAVCSILCKQRIEFTEITLHKLSAAGKRKLADSDLVITIGGDGTVLGASHYVTHGTLLGVNSAPGDSVGHFCHATRNDLTDKLLDVIHSRWQPTELTRLAVSMDGKPLPELALNDVLIAHDCPAATTRYLIRFRDHEEEHRSSGLWISTAAGSTAGIHSAGGRALPKRSRRLQYLVRELYREPNRSYQLMRGLIEPGEELTIASKMPEAHLYIDGAKTAYQFPFGTRATMTEAPFALRLLMTAR